MGKEITNNWYQILLEDLKKLEFAGVVMTKWNIGKRILKEEGGPGYGKNVIGRIAEELGTNARELWLCIQFAKKCDTITQFKDKSWYEITHKYLPEPRPIVKTPPLPEGKYNVIYADPAWEFDNSGFEQSAASHYPTMPTEAICSLPIKDITGEGAVLFLWATNAMLEDALRVMKSWGFEYKSNMAWIKDKGPTIGWFVEGRHELLLIGVNGSGVHPETKFPSWFKYPVSKHSKKPTEVYEKIEAMYPNRKYVELFARNTRSGWASWGNEL